jgi:hypothetical protein
LDSRLAFTRTSSTGGKTTSVNADGTIVYSSFDTPRFNHTLKEIKNLFLQSENTTSWGSSGILSRNASAIISPDGSLTGNLIIEDTQNIQHLVFQSPGYSATIGATYTFSIYAKQYSANRTLSLTLHGGSYPNFDLGSGRILSTGGYTCKMEDVGNGWYRCSITGTMTTTNGNAYAVIYNGTNSYTGDGVSGVYLWGGQLEIGTGPSRYVRTTTTSDSSYDITSNGLLSENSATNLMTLSNSSDLGSYYLDSTYVKRNTELAPDNTFSGDKLVSTITGGINNCFVQKDQPILTDGSTYVFSVFLKPGTSPVTTINLQFSGGTYQQSVVTVRWETKTIISDTVSNATIKPYGNGWYRISTALTNNGTNNTVIPRVYVRDQGTSNVRGETVFIWGWQVEKSTQTATFPTSYMPSTDTFISRSTTATYYGATSYRVNPAAINEARYDYFPSGLDANYLLLEPASTNLLTYTESFGNWSLGNGATITSNISTVYAPNFTLTADKLVESPAANGNVGHLVYYGRTASNETVTFSVFARAAERSVILLQLSNFNNETAQAEFDLTLGTAKIETGLSGTDYVNASAEILQYHDGWFRCILTATKNAFNTTNTPAVSLKKAGSAVYTGDGTSGVYLWGAQLEAGTSASSYIPATGASNVTRTADVYSTTRTTRNFDILSLSNINTSSWFNNKTSFGSFYIEFRNIQKQSTNGTYVRLLQFNHSSTNDYLLMAIVPNSYSVYAEARINNVTINTFAATTLTGINDKVMLIIDDVELIVVVNGTHRVRQTLTASVLDKFTTLFLGHDSTGSQPNGEITKYAYYPYPVSIDAAINLTRQNT